jgi:pimeloyl-ACP methyl ester carboxylesterase
LRRTSGTSSRDARGHGQTDKPHDPERYSSPQIVSGVTAVLDALGVGRAHFYGYSMGGRYGFGMAKHAPDRLLSLAIGGNSPFRNPERGAQFITLLRQGAEAFASVWEAQGPVCRR